GAERAQRTFAAAHKPPVRPPILGPDFRQVCAMVRPVAVALCTLLAALAGCTTRPENVAPATGVAEPAPSPPTAPPEHAAIALSWDDDPARKPWSAALVAAVWQHKAELDQGNPDAFIPGYAQWAPQEQVKFWAELVVAMAKFESNWN